jgi:hypothetical protein
MRTAAETIAQSGYEPHVRVAAPFHIVRAQTLKGEDPERTIEGTASVEGFMGDGVLLDPGGFPEAIRDYMEFGLIQSGHRLTPEFTIGKASDARWTDGVGMTIRGMVSRAPDVESTWIKIEEELLRALSLAFFILDGEWDVGIDAFRATRFVIPEVSVVPLPRDTGARFEVARSFRVPRTELRTLLEEKGRRERFLFGRPQKRGPATPLRKVAIGHDDVTEDVLAAAAVGSVHRHLLTQSLLTAVAQRVKS